MPATATRRPGSTTIPPAPATVVCWGGLDPGAASGLAADCHAAWALHATPRLVLTARTAQRDASWHAAWPVPAEEVAAVAAGLDLPARFAIKAGMLASLDNASQLLKFCANHAERDPALVVDPLWRATSGGSMWPGADETAVARWLLAELLPRARVVTPNWPELAWLTGKRSFADRADAERALRSLPCPAVLKGGHAPAPWQGVDLVWDGAIMHALTANVPFPQGVRGTGCRFATALAVGLVRGADLLTATGDAKNLVAAYALAAAPGQPPSRERPGEPRET